MFGYKRRSRYYETKDSYTEEVLRIPFEFPTIERVREDLINDIDLQIDQDKFVLAETGYVVKFANI